MPREAAAAPGTVGSVILQHHRLPDVPLQQRLVRVGRQTHHTPRQCRPDRLVCVEIAVPARFPGTAVIRPITSVIVLVIASRIVLSMFRSHRFDRRSAPG